MKNILFVCIGIIVFNIMACSKGSEAPSPPADTVAIRRDIDKLKKMPFHGDMKTTPSVAQITPVADAVKKNHLEISSTRTIGEAFDSYRLPSKKEWRETPTRMGSYFVDYVAWFNVSPLSSLALKEGVVTRRLEVKFSVYDSGETYVAMISRIEAKNDGMIHTVRYDPSEFKNIITAIYENREIPF